MDQNVLVIGSGGREHAICWKISQSKHVKTIFALPGSFGIGQVNKVVNVSNVDIKNSNVSFTVILIYGNAIYSRLTKYSRDF